MGFFSVAYRRGFRPRFSGFVGGLDASKPLGGRSVKEREKEQRRESKGIRALKFPGWPLSGT